MCKGSRPCGGAGKAVHSGCVGAGGWEATRLLTRTPLPGPPFQQLTPGEEAGRGSRRQRRRFDLPRAAKHANPAWIRPVYPF